MKTPISQRQALFAHCFGKLIVWLFDNGYEATVASGYVQPLPDGSVPGHMKYSVHGDRLAEDLNIYLVGRWMDGLDMKGDGNGAGDWQIPHWKQIGDFWKSLDPVCRWGGDFAIKDWNHFSTLSMDGKRA